MKKLSLFLLCLILVIGTLGAVATSAEETPADSLVEFVGYSARTSDFNGIRAEYALDTATLATLEKTYDVTIGVLLNAGVENYSDLTIETAAVNKVFYANGNYEGKYNPEKDGKINFVYAITFEEAESATQVNYDRDVSFRVYVKLDDAEYYVDNTSDKFGASISLVELAEKLIDEGKESAENLAMVRKVLDDTLYVGYNNGAFDNATLILDFYNAKATVKGKIGDELKIFPANEKNYKNTDLAAGSRFSAGAATYNPYIVYAAGANYVTGGTAPITSPWWFEDWYADWTVACATGNVDDMRTTKPDEYLKTTTKKDQTVYVVKTVVTDNTDLYVGNGEWGKKTYASEFGNGYFRIGANSAVNFGPAVTAATTENGSYTIQFIAKRLGSGTMNTFLGDRVNISKSGSKIKFTNASNSYYATFADVTTSFDADLDAVNTFTFSFDRADTAAVTLAAYVNVQQAYSQTVPETKWDNIFKVCESADINLYAIRVYDYVLSADEIAQNNFADLAKYFQLDLTGFYSLDASAKKAVYEAVASYTLESDKEEVQEAVTRAITNGYKVEYEGGFIWAKPGVSFELPVAISESKNEMFIGYFADGAQVTDANGVMKNGFVISSDIKVEAKFMNMYDALYVGYNKQTATFDYATLILDFYSATPDTEFVKSANYTDTTKTAVNRFGALPATYTPFTVFSGAEEGKYFIKGGTAPITSPWSFQNYYNEGYWKFEGGSATGGKGTADKDTATLTEVKNVTDYYITDAKTWTKMNYASSWGNGYFHMGKNSYLEFADAVTAAKNANNGDYTIQFIAARVGTGSWDTFVGNNRVSISEVSAGKLKVGSYYADYDIDNANMYTFTYEYTGTANTYNTEIFVNKDSINKTEAFNKSNQGAKIFESADANIYAIRIYSKVLSADEVKQNNFADIAKWHGLDVTDFHKANAETQAKVYNAFAAYTFETIDKETAANLLEDTIFNYVTVTYTVDEDVNTVKATAGADFTLPVVAKEGYVFLGYFADSVQVTDENGKKLEGFALTESIAVVAEYQKLYKVTYGESSVYADKNGSFTLPAVAKEGYVFLGYFADGVQVTDESGKKLDGYTLSSDIEAEAKYVSIYNALYVGYNKQTATFDNTSLILDFFSADENSAALTGSAAYYKDETKLASQRFNANADNYIPYTVYAADGVSISGGTAKVTSPWKFNNYYKEGYWPFEGGNNTSGSGQDKDKTTVRETTVENVTDYYISDGNYAKVTYASKWQKGSLNLGLYSTLNLSSAITNARGENDAYTVQVIFNSEDGNSVTAYYGARLTIAKNSNTEIKFVNNGTTYQDAFSVVVPGVFTDVNTVTVAMDRKAAENNFTAYVNNASSTTTVNYVSFDTNLKIYEGGNTSVYAIRVYDYALSADEVAQNNFADIAKWHTLDVAAFLEADSNKQAAVYKAFAGYTFNTIEKEAAQELLDDTLSGRVDVTYVVDGKSYTIDGYIGESFELPVQNKKGCIFKGYYADDVLAVGADGKSVAALTGAITVEAVFENIPYDTLYVGYNANTKTFDNTALILDFFYATEDTEFVKSSKWADESATAQNRFGALAATYTPFTVFSGAAEGKYYVTGGTTDISSPWKFKNYYSSGYWKWENVEGANAMDGGGGDKYTGTAVETTVTGITEYYITDGGKWAKSSYSSSFGNGYFHMGFNSYLDFVEAYKAAYANGSDYTIQFVTERVGASNQNFFVGTRGTLSESSGSIKISANADSYTTDNLTASVAGDLDTPNTFTFSFDRDTSKALNIKAFINNTLAVSLDTTEKTLDTLAKIFESADANIYAIRVYKYALSADEVAQNNFADLVKFFEIDFDFDAFANIADKQAVYNALNAFKLDSDKAEIEAVLDTYGLVK